jgi:glutathione S-transferase
MHTLFYTAPSPYARKVRVIAREKGLMGQITEVIDPPFENSPTLLAANPLGKIPALTRPDGPALIDSVVIAEYLDHLGGEPLFLPRNSARWDVLRGAALAHGLIDAAVNIRIETGLRDGAVPNATWMARWRNAIVRTLDVLEAEGGLDAVDYPMLNLAVGLAYLDFRVPDLDWRTGHAACAACLDLWAARPSFLETKPA